MAVTIVVGGAFQDSEGNVLSDGTLSWVLNRDAYTDSSLATLVCAGQRIEWPLDVNGNIPGTQTLWPNDQLLDVWNLTTDTFYTLSAFTADGQLAWGPNVIYVPTAEFFNITSVAPINPA